MQIIISHKIFATNTSYKVRAFGCLNVIQIFQTPSLELCKTKFRALIIILEVVQYKHCKLQSRAKSASLCVARQLCEHER
jgi:hypothetical protein